MEKNNHTPIMSVTYTKLHQKSKKHNAYYKPSDNDQEITYLGMTDNDFDFINSGI